MKPRSRSTAVQAAKGGARNNVRIIAGRWRGRRIAFPDIEGLRPTPDRVRETVFNWLQPLVSGARCLDLFAGSGVFGFECLSRGAGEAVFIERDTRICQQLKATASQLAASGAQIIRADALDWLREAAVRPFDLVFLDPPYASEMLMPACELLSERQWLAPEASIYLEAPANASLSFLPQAWRVVRSKRAGQVGYHLARVTASVAPSS
jgi:16S rRNA (guanine966-N2)-methyltransferase